MFLFCDAHYVCTYVPMQWETEALSPPLNIDLCTDLNPNPNNRACKEAARLKDYTLHGHMAMGSIAA